MKYLTRKIWTGELSEYETDKRLREYINDQSASERSSEIRNFRKTESLHDGRIQRVKKMDRLVVLDILGGDLQSGYKKYGLKFVGDPVAFCPLIEPNSSLAMWSEEILAEEFLAQRSRLVFNLIFHQAGEISIEYDVFSWTCEPSSREDYEALRVKPPRLEIG